MKISARLVSDSFPALQEKKIFIIVTWFRFFALSLWIPPWIRFILISTRTKNFPDTALTGIIAHELSHQERYLNMGIRKYILFTLGFVFSQKVREDEEKATDRLTIEKGYGRNIYEVSRLSLADSNHRRINANYLTPDEIRSYSEKIGKWEPSEGSDTE